MGRKLFNESVSPLAIAFVWIRKFHALLTAEYLGFSASTSQFSVAA